MVEKVLYLLIPRNGPGVKMRTGCDWFCTSAILDLKVLRCVGWLNLYHRLSNSHRWLTWPRRPCPCPPLLNTWSWICRGGNTGATHLLNPLSMYSIHVIFSCWFQAFRLSKIETWSVLTKKMCPPKVFFNKSTRATHFNKRGLTNLDNFWKFSTLRHCLIGPVGATHLQAKVRDDVSFRER